jgi:hypothetical protein
MIRILPFALLLSLAATTACEPRTTEPTEPRLVLASRVDSVGLSDTLTVQVRLRHGRETFDLIEPATWRVSGDSAMGFFPVGDDRALVYGKTAGRAWLVAEAEGLVDSVRLRVVRVPLGVAGFYFADPKNSSTRNDPRYLAIDGQCYTSTSEQLKQRLGHEWWWTQVGGFVVDGAREPMYRTKTEWTVSNPSLLAIRAAPDSTSDIEYRPTDQVGHTTLWMRDGTFTGRIDVYVDPENECRGIVGRPLPAAGFLEPEPGYVWRRNGEVTTLDGRRIPGARVLVRPGS